MNGGSGRLLSLVFYCLLDCLGLYLRCPSWIAFTQNRTVTHTRAHTDVPVCLSGLFSGAR